MDKTVSVVIPVYNTAPYLDACIESILRQTYPHLEILLINNGSTDDSPQICQAWANRDSRIRVIHTPNRGLGMARNTGLDAATGDYICFFDSDDYIAPQAIAHALRTAATSQSEVVVFGLTSVDPEGRELRTFLPWAEPRVYRGKQVVDNFLPALIGPDPRKDDIPRFYMSACLMLYSLPHLRQWNWQFVSEREIISEDVYSLLGLFGHVTSVAILPEALYYYRTNEHSLSRQYRPDRYVQIRHFYLACIDLCRRMGYSQQIQDRLASPYLNFTIAAIKQEVRANPSLTQGLAAIRTILQDDILQQALRIHRGGKPAQRLMRRVMALGWAFPCYSLAWAKNWADRLRH